MVPPTEATAWLDASRSALDETARHLSLSIKIPVGVAL
jgi:hypothetical protein